MLKGISPLISPELMVTLMKIGHADEIVLGDGNFPAEGNARRIVRADGRSVLDLLQAILVHFPLDGYAEATAFVTQPVDAEAAEPPIWGQFRHLLNRGRESRRQAGAAGTFRILRANPAGLRGGGDQ